MAEAKKAMLGDRTDDEFGAPNMTEDQRIPIESVLTGAKIHPFEAGTVFLEAYVIAKVVDPEGGATWTYRTTNAFNREELLGALTIQLGLLRRELLSEWE
jgi:hypothetical protein